MYLHHPQTLLAREIVQRGDLGEVCVIRGVFNFAMGSRENARLVPEYGGGCLWDVGVYPLSFAQTIYGSAPLRVSGEQWLGASGVDETFAGQMAYAGGGLAQISSAFRSPWYTYVEIIGSEGRLTLNRPFVRLDQGVEMVLHPKEREAQAIPVPEQYLYLGEVEDLHDAILESKPPRLPLAESREHVRTVLALYESAREERVVRMD